jgi:5-methylcytosine-specific restriction endonuclease McrA
MNYKGKKDQKFQCVNCNKDIAFRGYTRCTHKYCNNLCQREYEYKVETLPRFKQGIIKERSTQRKILKKEIGSFCFICKLDSWNGSPITLEVDHIDGNASNNLPENLRLLCPNCHSQTATWKGANKGKGRKSLGLQLN